MPTCAVCPCAPCSSDPFSIRPMRLASLRSNPECARQQLEVLEASEQPWVYLWEANSLRTHKTLVASPRGQRKDTGRVRSIATRIWCERVPLHGTQVRWRTPPFCSPPREASPTASRVGPNQI